MRSGVYLHAFEASGVQRQPKGKRRQINAVAKRVERTHLDPITIKLHVAAERLPSKLGMIDHVCCSVEDMAKKVWSIVTAVSVPFECRWKRVECYRCEAFLIYVGQRSHRAAITNAQKIDVVRMLAVMRQYRNGVES